MFNALRAVAKFLNRCSKVSKKSELALDASETVFCLLCTSVTLGKIYLL